MPEAVRMKLKQSEVNNADFLIVDNLNISVSDVSNEVYYNNKIIIMAQNNTNLKFYHCFQNRFSLLRKHLRNISC